MAENYQNLPDDTLNQMANSGDFEAYKELIRRVSGNPVPEESRIDNARIPQNPAAEDAIDIRNKAIVQPIRDYAPSQPPPVEFLDTNPEVRKPHLWGAFVLWLIWKKFSIIMEPAGICILLYAMYTMSSSTLDGLESWSNLPDSAVSFGVSLIIVMGLGMVAGQWLKIAWQRRPLTVWLVALAVVFWYDGIKIL